MQVAFYEAGGQLCGITGHVDDDRRLERIVRESAGPRRRAGAADGKAIARAAEPVRTRNKIVARRPDTLREIQQPQQVLGVDGMIAAQLPDAFGELTQVDARAARRSELFAHGLEVVDCQRMRQRLFDQLRH